MHIGHGAMPPIISANFSAAFDIMDVNLRTLTQLPPFIASCKSAWRLHPIAEIAWNENGNGRDCVASVGWRKPLSDPRTFHNVSPELSSVRVELRSPGHLSQNAGGLHRARVNRFLALSKKDSVWLICWATGHS